MRSSIFLYKLCYKFASSNLSLALLVVQVVEGVVNVLVLAVLLVAPLPRLLQRVLQLRGPN